MADKFADRLDGYVEVKDRIAMFYAAHPDGRLVTASASMTLDPDGVVRVWCQALAYRTADDPHPGVGWSYLTVPGTTPYTRGSEVENAETSAWGRAIGSLGIGIDKSIATGHEVRTKQGQPERDPGDGSLVGTVERGDKRSSDMLARQTPDGTLLGFRLRGDRGGILVETHRELADQLSRVADAAVGQRATVWGTVSTREFTPSGAGKGPVAYQVLDAVRMRIPGIGDLPSPGEPAEAPTTPMFDADEQAAIDAAIGVIA